MGFVRQESGRGYTASSLASWGAKCNCNECAAPISLATGFFRPKADGRLQRVRYRPEAAGRESP